MRIRHGTRTLNWGGPGQGPDFSRWALHRMTICPLPIYPIYPSPPQVRKITLGEEKAITCGVYLCRNMLLRE